MPDADPPDREATPPRETRGPVTFPHDAILTAHQVAEALSVGRRTIERMDLPSFKVGASTRYLWGQVLDYLAKQAAKR